MAWSWRRNQGDARADDARKADQALPEYGTAEYTEPNYRRGAPYSQEAVPTYADSMRRIRGQRPYDDITDQQESLPFGTYPPSGKPPSTWIGYEQDNWRRSERDEHVLNGDEGRRFGSLQSTIGPHGTDQVIQEPIPGQHRQHWALNPYWYKNIVNRPQRTPSEWTFIRKFDQGVLGARRLNGNHFSQAQTVSDNNRLALAGQVSPLRRRSTFRLEPTQYASNTVQGTEESGEFTDPTTYMSPWAGAARSFRLT